MRRSKGKLAGSIIRKGKVMGMKRLRIALTKGRLEKDTVSLLDKMGMDCSAVRDK